MTSINFDDPRLTAYVLGELDEADAMAVHHAAQSDPEIRAEIDAIRRLTGRLKSELGSEAPLALTADQKRNLEAAMAGGGQSLPFVEHASVRATSEASPWTRSPDFWRSAAALSAMAALVVLGIYVPRSLFDGGSIRQGGVAINAPERPAPGVSDTDLFAAGKDTMEAMKKSQTELSDAKALMERLRADQKQDRLTDTMIAEGGGPGGLSKAPSLDLAQTLTVTAPTAGENLGVAGQGVDKGVADELELDHRYAGVMRDQNLRAMERGASEAGQEQAPRSAARRGVLSWTAKQRTQTDGTPVTGDIPVLGQAFSPAAESVNSNALPIDAFTDPDDEPTTTASEQPTPVVDNPFVPVVIAPLSTFSIDVDTASYSNIRKYLRNGQMPPASVARVEEMINYFDYHYAAPSPGDEHPFLSNTEVAPCPWNDAHRLVRIGIQGMEVPRDDRPATNLVFLIDVSGSMQNRDKLPLIKEGLKMMVNNLTVDDKVAMVTYAGNAGVVLDSTSCFHRDQILAAIDNLNAGGSTHGSQGIQRAYEIATANFIKGGMNRVILATDGDFNVGITDNDALVAMIEQEAKSGVFLNVIGCGTGNLKDSRLEQLADHGNGTYGYVDDIDEARKVFVDDLSGTLVTIAKDVKIQVEFNPTEVKSYRLIGYENRMLAARDFNDDTKDAGEIGAGHSVTALYEVEPGDGLAGVDVDDEAGAQGGEEKSKPQAAAPVEVGVDPLRYGLASDEAGAAASGEWLTVKIRYKQPDGNESTLVEYPVRTEEAMRHRTFGAASDDFRFATSVAAFGMLMRQSPYVGEVDFNRVLGWASESTGDDQSGDRAEFLELVKKARTISGQGVETE